MLNWYFWRIYLFGPVLGLSSVSAVFSPQWEWEGPTFPKWWKLYTTNTWQQVVFKYYSLLLPCGLSCYHVTGVHTSTGDIKGEKKYHYIHPNTRLTTNRCKEACWVSSGQLKQCKWRMWQRRQQKTSQFTVSSDIYGSVAHHHRTKNDSNPH